MTQIYASVVLSDCMARCRADLEITARAAMTFFLMFGLAVTFALCAEAQPQEAGSNNRETGQKVTPDGDSNGSHNFVQISAVSIEPTVARAAGEGIIATITVQVYNSGLTKVSSPEVTVAVGTYAVTPAGNNVGYEDSPQTRSIGASPTVFKFKLHSTKSTVPGEITIQADIVGRTGGIDIREPDPPSLARAKLKIE